MCPKHRPRGLHLCSHSQACQLEWPCFRAYGRGDLPLAPALALSEGTRPLARESFDFHSSLACRNQIALLECSFEALAVLTVGACLGGIPKAQSLVDQPLGVCCSPLHKCVEHG